MRRRIQLTSTNSPCALFSSLHFLSTLFDYIFRSRPMWRRSIASLAGR